MRDTNSTSRNATLAAFGSSATRSGASARQVAAAVALVALTPVVVLAALSTPALAGAVATAVLATGAAMHARHR